MLQLKKIRKEYRTGDLVQTALNDVSLNLRDNEFVAILGPSGSGKTTLLNIVGGLDRYDSGDLIINGISTKKYTDRDWDSYRNHTIGFVFQSYNLIPHQTVLANVELALTISGISGAERKRRATEALQQVGLGNQLHKRPSEMSGGQMQRVAIARALVNNPDILLADEPTGALDSETSIQVMELLKEVAKDRLVVMVTHNPELAQQYATRIVNLKDGVIRSDTDPYEPDTTQIAPPVHKNMGRSSMSWLTSLALSFNNLRTKKARTLLTAFAGSIGIIGIALIISLSTGVNQYIDDMERDTLSEYPLQILSSGMDLTSLLSANMPDQTASSSTDLGEGMVPVRQLVTQMVAGITSNDLKSLKSYLESDACDLSGSVSSIEYSYNVQPQIYRVDDDGSIRQVNPDSSLSALGISSTSSTNSMMASMMNTSVFYQLPSSSTLYDSQYDVKAGRWPEKYNECVAVLGADGSITDYALYALGLRDNAELDKMIQQFAQNQNVDVPDDFKTYQYSDFLGRTFQLVNATDRYQYDDANGVWVDKSDDKAFMKDLVNSGETMTIVGVVQPKENASAAMLSSGIAYPASLTKHVMETAAASELVQKQMADPQTNILTGEPFGTQDASAVDMASLFSIDTDQLKSAFQFDSSKLNFDLSGAFDLNDGSVDFSSLIDPDSFNLDLSETPDMDMSALTDVFTNMDISIPADKVQELAKKVMNGYKDYIIGNGILGLDKIGFDQYLQSEQFQQLMQDSMGDLIDASAMQEQFADAMQQVMGGVMASYSEQIAAQLQTQLGAAMEQAMGQISQNLQSQMTQSFASLGSQMESALKIDANAFQNAIQFNMSEDDLKDLMKTSMLSTSSTYDSNLQSFGYASEDDPSQINIYPLDFEQKAVVISALDSYNADMTAQGKDEQVIQYTDVVGTLMTSVTKIINMISNMLVAFVSISLVVSSIMIGVITYISVLERRKEIGILRAIGASKRNISEVFNAETFIIGLCSGVMGVVLSLLLLIPGNMLIQKIAVGTSVVAVLPWNAAVVLIALATVLTMLGGFIPAKSASKSDPVKALRAE